MAKNEKAHGAVRDTKKRLYIAYGSNLNVEQMWARCPHATILGTAKLKDWRLLFRGSKTGAYLTIEPSKGETVPVGIWEVTEGDEAALDLYEGFPTFYYKKEIRLQCREMRTGRHRTVTAFAYLMREDRPVGLPSPYYVDVCREGYRAFDFDEAALEKALLDTRKEMAK